MKVLNIDVNKLEQNENSRTQYKRVDLTELMTSLKQNGQLQPIGITPLKNSDKYEVVFGNRRLVAAKKLGWKTIEAAIIDVDDDIDRDIINLVENFKRTNTTVHEDGRMFRSLVDRGLSREEISSRLGISKRRVDIALQVVSTFPAEYKKKVTNRAAHKRKPGEIPATLAMGAIYLREKFKLNQPQMKALLKFAADGGNKQQLASLAPLLKSGKSVTQAVKTIGKYEHFVIHGLVDAEIRGKLEATTGKKLAALIWDILAPHHELGIKPVSVRDSLATDVKTTGKKIRSKKVTA